jgi:BASS family bile acid:Na+ symporter
MDAAEIVRLIIVASVLLLVFALGARATFSDATSVFGTLFQPPHTLLRALAAMYVVVPAVAVFMGLVFDLGKPIRVGLLAMAIAPIPPILPGKQLKVGGSREHVFGLLVAVSVSAIVLVPVMVALLGRVFGRETSFGPWQVATLIGVSILLPLAAGIALRWLAPGWAERIAPWASRLGTLFLLAGVTALLVKVAPMMLSILSGGALLALVALAVVAIGAGHWLGGPDPADRAILAVAACMRHPGIALAVATANVPEEPRVIAAVLLYLLVGVVLTSLYGAFARRRLYATG